MTHTLAKWPQLYSGQWAAGHCQGIAVDKARGWVYFSFTTMLVKTDLAGRLLGTVTGLMGHLGCIAFNEADGLLYGSLEYKNDAIGQNILKALGSSAQFSDGFYIVIFDGRKIDRLNLDACHDGVMTCVYLKTVLDDFKAQVSCGGKTYPHRHGCSGIDGVTFAPIPGGGPRRLLVAYGVYSDVDRPDNDYQVILSYDPAHWPAMALPLSQAHMHTQGPAAPNETFFLYTGNTTYGVQNMEFDPATGNILLAVYKGKKAAFPNHSLYVIDGSAAPYEAPLQGVDYRPRGQVLTLLGNGTTESTPGWDFPYGATGLCALGDGAFYVSHDGRKENLFHTHLKTYRWDGLTPLVEG